MVWAIGEEEEGGKRKGRIEDGTAVGAWGTSGGTFSFSPVTYRQSGTAEENTDWKEALDSSLGSLSDKILNGTGSVSSVCNMGRLTEEELNVGPMWYHKGMQNKFLANSEKYGSGAQEKVNTRTE